MKLYHGSYAQDLKIVLPKQDLFHGIFFTASKHAAESHGDYVYAIEINDDEILNARLIEQNEKSKQIVRELYSESTDEELEEIISLASGSINIWNEENEMSLSRLSDILRVSCEIEIIDWECQNVAGYIAEKLGYKAVALRDEHGTSYLVLPGNKIMLNETN